MLLLVVGLGFGFELVGLVLARVKVFDDADEQVGLEAERFGHV